MQQGECLIPPFHVRTIRQTSDARSRGFVTESQRPTWRPVLAPRRLVAKQALQQSESGKPRHCARRSEEHTSELQSLMRISYAVFCLKKTKHKNIIRSRHNSSTQRVNSNHNTKP